MSDSSSMMMVMMMGMVASCGMVCVGGLGAWYLKDPTMGGLLGPAAETTTPSPSCPPKEEWNTTSGSCKKIAATTSSAATSLVGKTVYIGHEGRPLSFLCAADKNGTQMCIKDAHKKAAPDTVFLTKWKVEAYTSTDGKKSSKYLLLKSTTPCGGSAMYLTAPAAGAPVPTTWADKDLGGVIWTATAEGKKSGSDAYRQQWVFYKVSNSTNTYKIVSRKFEKELRKYLEENGTGWVGSGSQGTEWTVSDSKGKAGVTECQS